MRKLKLFLTLLMLMCIGVTQMWATDVSVTLSSGSFATDHITWTVADGNIAISQLKGSSSTAVNSSYISAPRVYKGHVLSFVASNGYKINSIEITVNGTYYGNSMTAGTVMSGNTVTDNTTDVSRTWITTSGGKHVVSAVADEGLSAIYIQNVASAANVQLRISALKITYTVPTSSDVIVKTLKSIAVSGQTTEYDQNDIFSFDGTCTATYSVTKNNVAQEDEEKVVTPTSVSSPDMTTTGEKEVTVSFTDGDVTKTAKYNITVNEHVVNPGEYTINLNNTLFGTSENSNITSAVNAKQDDISLVINGTGSTKPRMDASYVRFYASSSLTLSVPAGYNITKIVYAYGSNKSDEQGVPTANVGTIDSSNKQWTGKANEVVLSFSAKSFIASVTVTYAAIAPEVTVDPEELSFTAKQNIAVAGKTFTLTGADLSSGLTLAASTGFTVSPTSLTAEAAMVEGGVEVTVTPATPTATTTPVEGTVTISGGGLSESVEVALSMTVAPTYQVGVAVNSNTMGSATINGGSAAVYVTADDEIALVATPAEHHEFVNWTVSDENIVLNNANAASTTALAGAAGTITANFQQQACQALAAPVLDEITKTYQSATIAWNAVSNASAGYEVYVYNDSEKTSTKASDIVTEGTSFAVSNLDANTTYYYTVMAIGDGSIYCDASNPVLESSFTTNDYPAATLSLVENGGEAYAWGSNLKMNDVIALPTELAGLGCSGKVLVGWSSVAVAETDEEPTANYWVKGADYTIASTADKLYAVLATQTGGGANDVVFNAGNYATANNWENSKAYTSFTIDGITFTAIGGGNNGKYYTSDKSWRFYNGGSLSISGTGITGVSSTPSVSFTNNNGTYSASFSATKQFTSIVVSVSTPATFEAYTTSCTEALPVLEAPTFDLAAGSYYDALQTVTLSATNEAAIYYTLDGTDPTNESTLYSEPIALDTRKEYTIKAIAIKAGFESSEIATRTYNIVLPYDFATFAALEKVNGKEYAVRGIISEKGDFNTQYSELAYYISADGQKAGQIKCHNGLKQNKETFTSADDVNLGDNVTVVGTWSTQYSNFSAANWMLEYTARVHASYAIEGELTASSFDDGDAYDAAILANLTVKETFTNGYYENVAGVTFNAGEKTAWAEGDTKLTVNAVLNEAVITTKDFDVVVTSAQLASIALKADDGDYQTKKVYFLGESFVAPTIVATLDDKSVYDAEATYVSGFDNANAGVQEVTVSYTRGTVTETTSYSITMKAIYNNDATPHNVTEALDIIGKYHTTTTASTDSIVVAGIVSRLDGTYVNTYWISDDGNTNNELEIYSGKYLNKVAFTAANQLHVGDVVVVKGKVKTYNNIKEFDSNSRLISVLREPEFAIADVVAADEFEANVSEDMAVVPTANSGDVEFTLASNNEEAVTIVEGKLHAVAEGDAVITASRAATANENALNYTAKEITFNVHVIAERARYTVTFDANGGEGSDPEAIANQLAGATVDMPAACLYNKEGHGFTGWKVINLSSEAEIEVENDQFEMPAANVKIQAQWAVVATCAISFQVGGQEVATANAPQENDYNISQVGAEIPGFTFLGWSETEYADEVETAPTLINVYHAQAGEENKVLYGIYSREEDYGNQHYVLDYVADGVGDQITAAYGNAVNITATDGGQWVVKAYKNAGMQINTGKNGSIKVPSCPGDIVSIGITCSIAKSVGFSASDYSGSGTITYVVSGTDATSQTLSFSGLSVKDGYIVPKGGSTAITHIDVEYSTAKTVYTSSPKEKVKVTFDVNGGNGGCQTTTIDKGSELTICDIVPTKAHSEFLGWKNGDDVYVAGTAYTFDADITLTAQWDEAVPHTVTYDVNGSEDAAPTIDAQYAGDQFAIAAGVTKDGYTFKGWLYNNKLYKAGTQFLMPDEAVVFVANWKKSNISTDKMMLISDESGLANGMTVALGCSYVKNEENKFEMAGDITGTNKYMNSVSGDNITLNNGLATFTDAVVTMIAEQVEDGWKLRKDETHYLTLTGTDVKWDTQANATAWTISFNNGNVQIASGNNKMQFNSNNPRFKTYTSNQTAIQLFGKATVVTETANVSDLGYEGDEINIVASGNITLTINVPTNAQSITATNGATVVIEEPTTAENVVVEEGSKIVANAETTTPTVYFATTMGVTDNNGDFHSTASELGSVTNITLADGGEIIYDLTLGTNKDGVQADPNQWHAFSLPFAVDAINGIYDAETGAKLENEVNYAIMDYHGDFRADGQYGWKKYRGILQPGVFYLMTVDGATKTFRFKAAKVGAMTQTNTMSAQAYDGAGEESDKGWNGFGNPRWIEGTFAYNAQYLDPYTYDYVTITPGMTIPVGLPFFYKAATTSDVSMGEVGASYAPARNTAYEIKNVAIRFGNEVSKDKLYISASEDALNEYEQDKDLVKMFMSQTPKVARISGNAYGMKLCVVNAPMANDQAEYSLTLYAPNAGEYTISAPEMEDADIFLTYEGSIIWNLSMGAYTNNFAKGNNEGYGLILVKKAPQVSTGVDNAEVNEAGVQKVIINKHVYILRAEQMYDVTGKMVK